MYNNYWQQQQQCHEQQSSLFESMVTTTKHWMTHIQTYIQFANVLWYKDNNNKINKCVYRKTLQNKAKKMLLMMLVAKCCCWCCCNVSENFRLFFLLICCFYCCWYFYFSGYIFIYMYVCMSEHAKLLCGEKIKYNKTAGKKKTLRKKETWNFHFFCIFCKLHLL